MPFTVWTLDRPTSEPCATLGCLRPVDTVVLDPDGGVLAWHCRRCAEQRAARRNELEAVS